MTWQPGKFPRALVRSNPVWTPGIIAWRWGPRDPTWPPSSADSESSAKRSPIGPIALLPAHIPKDARQRPTGVERNLVITMWDWANPTSRRSDMAATDERTPTLNANGLVYGAIQSSDIFAVLDPRTNTTSQIKIPLMGLIDANTPESPYWGDEKTANWPGQSPQRRHRPPWQGVGYRARIRKLRQQPDFCKDGSMNEFAKYFPLTNPSARQVEVYDPETRQFTMIDTCFSADHTHFDENDQLVYGQTDAIGWLDTKEFDKSHDAAASQGWCPAVVDTNGDGKISEGWTQPDQPVDPQKDHRVHFGCMCGCHQPHRWQLVVLGNRQG